MLTQHKPIAEQILSEVFNDLNDLGEVDNPIEPNCHTADFDLSEGWKMRCLVNQKGVYYNTFRVR